MIVLGIDGALGGFSAAVADDAGLRSSVALDGNVALEGGLGAIARALAEAQVERSQLDRLAVSIGPGGFTGLRIAIVYAKSLAQAWGLPLVPISSFDLLGGAAGSFALLEAIVGRPGIVSLRFRAGATERRASGPVGAALAEVLAGEPPGALDVAGAPEDVLAALAEAGWTVTSHSPAVTPPAAAVALAGRFARPAANAHDVRADYGEAPAARVPDFRPAPRNR